ncbi:MAG: FtsX-like permease family protein [Planctomycetota bacterium]
MRLLPADYALRNAGRRPLRTAITVFSSLLVTAVVAGTTAFVRGLEHANLQAAPPRTAILLSNASQRDIVRSAITPATADIVAADVKGIARIGGVPAVSAEVHLATSVRVNDDPVERQGFLRGITERAFLVHDGVTIVEGRPPRAGEALVGRLVSQKLGLPEGTVGLGDAIAVEGGSFRVSGVFRAPGSTIESEIWVPLVEIQGLSNRDDISAVFARVETDDDLALVDLFAKRNLDLELLYLSAADYYRELAAYFGPLRDFAWLMAGLIALAALFSGANTQNAAVQDRIRELATLRAMGYSGFALVFSLVQEALLVASLGAIAGLLLARGLISGSAVNLAMTAFALDFDGLVVVLAFGAALLVALVGTLPAAWRVMRLPIATAIKEDA